MRDVVRRTLLALGLAMGVGLLTGCSVTGEVWLGPEDVRVDLQVSHANDDGPQLCRDELFTTPDLDRSPIDSPRGTLACRITGTLALTDPHASNWFISTFDDHVVMQMGPVDPVPDDAAIDLTVHVPGEVVAVGGGGVVDGTTVRWTDITAIQKQGLALTARTRPGLPDWLAPASGGLVLGLLGVAAIPLLRRLRAKVDADPMVDAHPADSDDLPPPEPTPTPEPELPPEDPEVWSRP